MAEVQTMPAVEVPEPDLSMEVQDQLRRSLTDNEVRFFAALDEEQETPVLETASSRAFAGYAVGEAVRMLKKFNPEATKDVISDSIHSMIHSEALVGHLAKRSQEALREYVPRDRAAWLAHDIEGHAAALSQRLALLRASFVRTACLARVKGLELATDRGTHVVMLSAGSGAVVLGCTGGVVGTCGGATAGTIAGVVPALLTFGLSLPAGAVVGGGVGGCLGAAAGTLSGLVGGGASGGVAYRYRAEIGDGAVHIKVKALRAKDRAAEKAQELQMVANSWVGSAKAHAGGTVQALSDATSEAAERAKVFGHVAATSVHSKASELGTNAKALALNPAAQATSAGAAGGSVTVGAAGGGLGLLAGGAAGAAVGLVPALFTFGLSIPVCAAIGGGAGACLGTAAGGTTGFVGGGAVGYGAYNAYSQRKEISLGASEALTKLGGMAESVKEGAKERANMSASFIKARLSGTGGTQ